jgi:hypothetical protein
MAFERAASAVFQPFDQRENNFIQRLILIDAAFVFPYWLVNISFFKHGWL